MTLADTPDRLKGYKTNSYRVLLFLQALPGSTVRARVSLGLYYASVQAYGLPRVSWLGL